MIGLPMNSPAPGLNSGPPRDLRPPGGATGCLGNYGGTKHSSWSWASIRWLAMGPPMSSLILLASLNPWAPGACVCFCPDRLGPVSPEDGGVNRWEPVCRPLEAIITLLGNLIYLKGRVLILANSLSGLCVKWRGGAGLNHLTESAFLLGSWNLCGDQGRLKGQFLGLGDQAPTLLAAASPGILKTVPLYLVIWYKPHIAAFPAQPGGASNCIWCPPDQVHALNLYCVLKGTIFHPHR